jgi:hypothetical protein
MDGNDLDMSLGDISKKYPNQTIATCLTTIQDHQVSQQKSIQFLEELECLYFPKAQRSRHVATRKLALEPSRLRRRTVNAHHESEYAAISYPWKPSATEVDTSDGLFLVQKKKGSNKFRASPVRNTIFHRARNYMDHNSVKYLWIDQHCIEQQKGPAKEIGMQAMDRVYGLSKYPVALLFNSISSRYQLHLLTHVLTGQLVYRHHSGYCLSRRTSPADALKALKLLRYITADKWFTRGWIYQENYRGGEQMVLLIPHHENLNPWKCPSLGSLRNELCIKSIVFHDASTKLCVAYQSHQPPPRLLEDILSRAGRYSVLLQSGDNASRTSAPLSMSPHIIKDVIARELTERWDSLPIIANCCQYSLRLDSTSLQSSGQSLSLSVLVLCLANGEILSNNPKYSMDVKLARTLTVTEFLERHTFSGMESPLPRGKLTFNKGCRFYNASLEREGIATCGYL